MTPMETSLNAGRPMVKLFDGTWAEWCPCGTAPTPPDGEGDVVIQRLGGKKRGQLILMHYRCMKQGRKVGS